MSKCEACVYWRPVHHRGDKCCHYALVNNELRGCPAGDNCNKFEPYTDENNEKIKQRMKRNYNTGGYIKHESSV